MSKKSNQTSNTSKVVKGMSSQTLVTIVLGIVEIVSFSYMSRLLTQDDFGYYAAITAITIVFSTFSDTGIGSAIIQQKELTKRFVDNAFTISLLFGSFISLLLLFMAEPLSRYVADDSMKFPLMLMSGTLLLQCLTSVNLSLMHRKLQFLRMGSIKLIAQIITTGIAIFLAYEGLGYYAIITKAILYSILVYILSLILCNTKFGLALDKGTFKKIFSFSGWLMASSLFRNLAHEIDRLLMPRLLSVSALGAYNRPKDFVEQMSSKLNGIFDSALFPVLSSLQDNKAALASAYRRSLYLMNVFALLVTMGFMFNSELLIRIFFGEQWIDLRSVMLIISCSLLFNFDGRLADCYLRSLAMTQQQFYFRIFETVLKTVGVLVGFKWGIVGVAISVVITNSLAKLIKIIYIGGKLDIKLGSVLGIIFLSWRYGVLMIPVCIVAYVFLPHTWGGNVLNAIVYVVITIFIFFFFPNFVGKRYRDDVYVKMITFINKRFHLKGRKNEV